MKASFHFNLYCIFPLSPGKSRRIGNIAKQILERVLVLSLVFYITVLNCYISLLNHHITVLKHYITVLNHHIILMNLQLTILNKNDILGRQ